MTSVDIADTLLETESEDEDYVPGGEPKEEVSEENEDGESEKTEKSKKLTKTRKRGRKKALKRGKEGSDEDSDDDEEDVDFILNEKATKDDCQEETAEDPELVALREKAEKERTDRLWSDFLNSVETTKAKKKELKESGGKPQETMVTKIYDFAGEKVEVREKINGDFASKTASTSSNKNLGESTSHGSINSNGPGGQIANNKLVLPRKTRISFLSGDPADIGLAGDKKISAREGLANVLNALHARNKKLGTLEKSKLDWEKYKNEQNLSEELDGHTRSKNGFIDKQEFLQRADLRQFEIEKQARAKRRRNI